MRYTKYAMHTHCFSHILHSLPLTISYLVFEYFVYTDDLDVGYWALDMQNLTADHLHFWISLDFEF